MNPKTLGYFAYTITHPTGVPTSITVWGIVGNALGVALPLGAVIFVAMFVYAGINYMMSQGDMGKIKGAQAMMSNAIVGFVILTAAFFILQLINYAITGKTLTGL